MERANAVIGEVVCATTTVLGELSDRCHIYGDKYTTHVLTVTEKLPRVLRKGMGVLFFRLQRISNQHTLSARGVITLRGVRISLRV